MTRGGSDDRANTTTCPSMIPTWTGSRTPIARLPATLTSALRQRPRAKKQVRCATLGAVVTIYSAVMFTRVERLAAGLAWPRAFVLLAAGLITVITVGGMLVLPWWWSRSNGLGDQLRERRVITDESRTIAEGLANQSRAYARLCAEATDHAYRQLDLAERVLHHGYHTIGVGLQKAAKILDQQSVLTPKQRTCSRSAGQPLRDRAKHNIEQGKAIIAEAQQILIATLPFESAGPHSSPWAARSALGGPANPAFVDPYQLGTLHVPEPRPFPLEGGMPWVSAVASVALLAVAVLVVAVILAQD